MIYWLEFTPREYVIHYANGRHLEKDLTAFCLIIYNTNNIYNIKNCKKNNHKYCQLPLLPWRRRSSQCYSPNPVPNEEEWTIPHGSSWWEDREISDHLLSRDLQTINSCQTWQWISGKTLLKDHWLWSWIPFFFTSLLWVYEDYWTNVVTQPSAVVLPSIRLCSRPLSVVFCEF